MAKDSEPKKPVTRFGRVFQRPGRSGWYVRVRRRGMGDLMRLAGTTEAQALRYLARLEVAWFDARAAGKPLAPPSTTLTEFSREYLRGAKVRMSPAAYRNAEAHLRLAAERLPGPMSGITPANVADFVTWLRVKREAKPGTANRYLSTLSGCFREAKARGFMAENPCAGMRRLKVQEVAPPYLSEADRRALERHAPREWRPLLALASATGLRQGELVRLQWRDLDLQRGTVTVRESKSRRVRHVPLVGPDLEDARRIPRGAVRLRGEDPVFPGIGRRLRWLARHLPAWAKAAGLPRLTFHGLRHGWASRLAESGADDAALMDLGGWTSSAMVRRYAHHRPEGASRAAVERAVRGARVVPSRKTRRRA